MLSWFTTERAGWTATIAIPTAIVTWGHGVAMGGAFLAVWGFAVGLASHALGNNLDTH